MAMTETMRRNRRAWRMRAMSAATAYDQAAVNLFAAMTVKPSGLRQTQINTLIVALKLAGIWTKLDVFYVLAAHDAQASLLNWKNPGTYDLTAVNAPTFETDRGYTGNGTTSYLDATYAPDTNGVAYLLNSAHLAVWNRTATAQAAAQIGYHNTNGHVYARFTDNNTYARIHGGNGGFTTTSAAGLIIGTRQASNLVKAYRNGSSLGSITDASTAISSGSLRLLGVPSITFSTHQIAAASAGGAISDANALAYYTPMQTYMTAVGA